MKPLRILYLVFAFVGGVLIGKAVPLYEFHVAAEKAMWRCNRLTGVVAWCALGDDGKWHTIDTGSLKSY